VFLGNQTWETRVHSERYGEATAEPFNTEKCCLEGESLVGDWKAVGVLERTGSNHDDIDDSPNHASAAGDELEDSGSNLSGVEVVHTQSSEEDRKDQ
jgi:hypothetical protein